MEYCTKAKKKFENYDYMPVGWSGDKLPCCPYCRVTPYDKEKYQSTHKKVETAK